MALIGQALKWQQHQGYMIFHPYLALDSIIFVFHCKHKPLLLIYRVWFFPGVLPPGTQFDLFRGTAAMKQDEDDMYPTTLMHQIKVHVDEITGVRIGSFQIMFNACWLVADRMKFYFLKRGKLPSSFQKRHCWRS